MRAHPLQWWLVTDITYVRFFARFKSAVRDYPQILTFVENLASWFIVWRDGVNNRTFADPIASSPQPHPLTPRPDLQHLRGSRLRERCIFPMVAVEGPRRIIGQRCTEVAGQEDKATTECSREQRLSRLNLDLPLVDHDQGARPLRHLFGIPLIYQA